MKKFISLIALAGVFAACEPENLQTAFTETDASLTIHTKVVSAAPDFVEKDAVVTYEFHFGMGSSRPTETNTTGIVKGDPAIPTGYVLITAEYNGASAQTEVTYPQILAGLDLEFQAVVFIPYNAGEYTLSVKEGLPVIDTKVYGLKASEHGHDFATAQTATFDGKEYKVYMMQNATEFILEDSYKWDSFNGYEVEGYELLNTDFEDQARFLYEMAESQSGITSEVKSYQFSVGAWSLYNVINPVSIIRTPMEIVAKLKDGAEGPTIPPVAKFTKITKASGAGVFEMKHPDHAAHYIPHTGHLTPGGHALHGDNNNAGGGIISAE